MRALFVFILLSHSTAHFSQTTTPSLSGLWKGIDMRQDDALHYNKNFYLPNNELMRIDGDSVHVYLYPYSKLEKYSVVIDAQKMRHQVGDKILETKYFLTGGGDSLIFEMLFNNKTFKKVYAKVTDSTTAEPKKEIIMELDTYGFNGGALQREFEFDTLHPEFYTGFKHIDSLNFVPYQHLDFINSNQIRVNRGEVIRIGRGYRTITFDYNGTNHEVKIFQSESTQKLMLVPTTLCQCDSIVLPYIYVGWADRIRKDMIENKWKYKQRVDE